MPHIIVEYSSNLDGALDVDALVGALHQTMIDAAVADTAAIRTRAVRCAHFCVGDRDPKNAFVQITVRMREGRPKETLETIGKSLFAAAEKAMEQSFESHLIGLALEMHEITQVTYRRNAMRDKAGKAA